jgi:glycerol-3-phosphate dehydrogenase
LERAQVCVIGGGVVGVSVMLALVRYGVDAALVEAEPELALAASGTNSGILHTGFDSPPGTLETRLLRRSAELREHLLDALKPPLLRTGALVRPSGEAELAAVEELAHRAGQNQVTVERRTDGSLFVPDEMVTDPVMYTLVLSAAAQHAGARVTCGARIDSIERRDRELLLSAAGEPVARCRYAVNAAGLHADEVARAAGDDHFRIVPRKGEFFVFDQPADGPLEQILLPAPSAGTKGVLVFPTTDGKLIAGPTAIDQQDKRDWSVRAEARDELVQKAIALLPELEDKEPIASYAGLRTAGAEGENYLIERSAASPQLLHVAAIRSTGLSASPGIAEYVLGCLEQMGLELGPERPLAPGATPSTTAPWWRRSAKHWAAG